MRQTVPIKRRQSDLYLVACVLTGSSDDTSDDPKFAHSRLFETYMRPMLKELVVIGGKFAGHLPIFQGDSTCRHVEKKFIEGIAKMCEEEG